MDKWVSILMLGILVLSLYKGMTWLAGAIGIVIVLAFIGERPRKPVAPAGGAAQAKEEEEVLTPVIVTDAGEPPYLYPPKMIVKVNPKWGSFNFFENAALGIAGFLNLVSKTATGKRLPGYKYEKRWGVDKILSKKS